ncbi:MAG TPA: universal stress protein [Candidatus Deferrimicrobiaceae bacterium]
MYATILVPLDGSALSERAVPHAKMIASGGGSEIVLVRAVVNPMLRLPETGIPDEAAFIESLMEDARRYLSHVAEGLRSEGFSVRTEVREGEPEDVILDLAREEDAGLIVMGTHGRSGFSLLVMGSVAEKVMHATGRPVLFVKPEKADRRAAAVAEPRATAG